MKKINHIIFSVLILLSFNAFYGCEREIKPEEFGTEEVDFIYVGQSIHYVVGSEISFINKSIVGSTWDWSFGDGQVSNEKNPVYKYSNPGTYTVTLSVDGGLYIVKKKLFISDIVPVVKFSTTDPAIIFNKSEVQFDVLLENPENKTVTYSWKFPVGTSGEGVDASGLSAVNKPKVVFGSIGSQMVTLTVTIGDKQLAAVNVNVRVNYNKPARTLYYAVKGGNLVAKKIIDELSPVLNNPFDLGYRSGKHPLTLQFSGDWLYVFDAGTRTGFTAAPLHLTAGDGELFAVFHDGSKRETVVENFGGDTFLDFYYGYIDQQEGNIYWTDRRQGVYKTSVNTRNRKFSQTEFQYFVQNEWLGYYANGITWGNVNGPFFKYNGVFWWAKNSNGAGIFRFVENDILGRARKDGDPLPASGALFVNQRKVRGMVIDEVNQKLYISTQDDWRIRRYNIDGTGVRTLEAAPFDGEGGTSEGLFVTGMAVDVAPDGSGYMYWAYRGPAVPAGVDKEEYYAANPTHRSGIKRVKLNEENPVVEYFIKDVEVYGLAIDKMLR